ncbi:MAG: site-specific integrase [Rubrobacteraceae bacterium]
MAKRRGNGEGSISRHPKRDLWMARYTAETAAGTKRRIVYGKTRAAVRDKLAKALADRADGIVFDDENMTVGEYLERWLSDCVRGSVRESTFSRDKYLMINHAIPAPGRIQLKNLSALRLQGLYRDRLDAGLGAATVQKMHQVLHKAFEQAVKWNLIPRNPADGVKAPTPVPKEMRPLPAPEAHGLLEAARDDRFEAFYVLALRTRMRSGELLGLKWEDIELGSVPTVRARRTLTRIEDGKRLALGEPKTKKSRRTIRLTARAVEALKRHRARQAEEKLKAGALYEDQGLVFAGEGGGLVNPSNLRQRSFAPLLKKAGLPHITFHDLRHTCASLLFQRNVHPKFVQELLGHASVAITLDTYSHMLPGMGGEAADAMGEALG